MPSFRSSRSLDLELLCPLLELAAAAAPGLPRSTSSPTTCLQDASSRPRPPATPRAIAELRRHQSPPQRHPKTSPTLLLLPELVDARPPSVSSPTPSPSLPFCTSPLARHGLEESRRAPPAAATSASSLHSASTAGDTPPPRHGAVPLFVVVVTMSPVPTSCRCSRTAQPCCCHQRPFVSRCFGSARMRRQDPYPDRQASPRGICQVPL